MLQSRYSIIENRQKWKHGFSQCMVCQKKLMAYLEKGHSFDEIMDILKKRHPNIKNLRAYTRNAIRQTTGLGIFDNFIIEHNLWTVRNPTLAPPDIHKALQTMWRELAEKGRYLIENDDKVSDAIEKKDEVSKLILHAMSRSRISRS